jgi:thiosulfate/3-mercaptopyruvate sulfurtransferase
MGGQYAARLWWTLRWAGHANVSVLDGGLQAWLDAGFGVEGGAAPTRSAGRFSVRPALVGTVDYEQVYANLGSAQRLVIDARAADRFRGENETIDAIGGHIPGAVNRLYRDNLDSNGFYKPAAQLKAEFEAVTGGRPPGQLISQCGSGVTACHNLLAMEVAGLHGAALYPGSWSEWSSRPGSPIGTGAQP